MEMYIMRKYWYTILLTISLSGAAAARMIPDSVAEAVAAEIIDIGTDLRMTAKAYADGGQTLAEKPPAEPDADQEASSERNPAAPLPADSSASNDMAVSGSENNASSVITGSSTDSASTAASSSENVSPAAEESSTVSSSTKVSGDSHPSALPEVSTQNALSIPENPDFTNVLFIGDSRTAGLSEYGDLGQAEVFADSGMSVFNLFDSRVKTKSGNKLTLRELLSQKQFQTIYLMLGINELGYEYSSIIKKYQSVVDTIRSLQPGAVLVLQANLHVTGNKSASSSTYNNEKINRLNSGIQTLAEENRCFYLDVNPVFDDENGNLKADYSTDGSHVLGKYYSVWVDWLKEASETGTGM